LEPDYGTKGILSGANPSSALSKQTLWLLPGPWGTPAVKCLLQ
jgi:hypothetical protein